jgi:two-component system OmpR family sensor kinase
VTGRFSLRSKLIAAVLVLVTCALSIMAMVTATALRRYLISRLDDQIAVITQQLQAQIDQGEGHLNYVLPAPSSGVNLPTPFVLFSTTPDGTLIDYSTPLPPTQPKLTVAQLNRTDYFVVRSGSGASVVEWRVRVLQATATDSRVVVAANMSDVDSATHRTVLWTVFTGLGIILLTGFMGGLLVRTSLRPLVDIERAAAVIAAGDLTRRVPVWDRRTEVGRLGYTFNTMIEHIEHAFADRTEAAAQARASQAAALRSEERMRQFIADASHELRTPLTSIRGFAELYRQGAFADPEAAARLVRRIEDEAQRMGLLVEDLLLLARLDQQRPMAREPVDLSVLAADAVESARVIEPSRVVDLSLAGGPLLVTGDEYRLRQVIGNLVDNALKHTPPEATVAVRLGRRPGRALIEVSDNGPGLSPEQARRVFERFYRADPARSRRDSAPGTGLGLAIVAAIVAAHGGTVEVDTEPGVGATFRVALPAPVPAEQLTVSDASGTSR